MHRKYNGRLLTLFMVVALAVLASTIFVGGALAAAGDPDPSFGSGGKQTVSFTGNDEAARGLVVQSDGKVVMVGTVFGGSSNDFAITRLTAAGQLDLTFNGTGKATLDIGTNSNDEAFAATIDSFGNILVAGGSDGYFAVASYQPDGTLDAMFGSNGIATVRIGGNNNSTAHAIAVRGDGKIMLAGVSDSNIAVARLTANGDPDNTFNGGSNTVDFNLEDDEAQAVIATGNKTVVGGYGAFGGVNRFALVRFKDDGSLDDTFNGTGKVTTAFPDGSARIESLVAQTDGKIIAAGQALTSSTDFDFAVVRYNTTGGVDNTFGGALGVTADFGGSSDEGHAVAYDSATGKVTVAGQAYVNATTNNDFALARYNGNGTPDATFGSGGKKTTDFNSGANDGAYAIALAPGNKIVAAGYSAPTDNASASVFAVVRYSTVTPTPTPTRSATPRPTATPGGCTINFSDVHADQFFYEPVRYLFCANAISGYSDNTFRPFANTTRGQLSKIVVLAENFAINAPATPTFSDVPTSNPFYSFIETAVGRGIISGYQVGGHREFRPNADVTRGQLSKIVVKAENWALVNPATPTFTDVATTNPFYKEIETAVSKGIISGYDIGGGRREFRWGNNATRGQIAKIVYGAVTAP